jgi:alpha-galactosidase/6-phospho-beta-glucosidase family protein
MTARAAIDGDRLTALQALAADPLCAGVTLPQAREMLDELLSAHSDLLPQFV